MLRNLLLAIATMAAFSSLAMDVVTLRDGTILKGEIYDRTEDGDLLMKLPDGNRRYVFAKEIRNQTQDDDRFSDAVKKHSESNVKFRLIVDGGGYVGITDNQTSGAGFSITPGIGISFARSELFIGIGWAYSKRTIATEQLIFTEANDSYDRYSECFDITSVKKRSHTLQSHLALRYTISAKKLRPFIDFKAGSYIEIEKDPGIFLSPSIGCGYAIAKRFCIFASLGYEATLRQDYYCYYSEYADYHYDYYDSQWYHSLSLKLGFQF